MTHLFLLGIACSSKDNSDDSSGVTEDEAYWESKGPYTSLSVSKVGFGLCAIDVASNLLCWDTDECKAPAFGVAARQVVLSGFDTCILDDLGTIHCRAEGDQSYAQPLAGTFDVFDVDFDDICAGNEGGVACGSQFQPVCGTEKPSSALGPVDDVLVYTDDFACAKDVEGMVTCWGNYPGSDCGLDKHYQCDCEDDPPRVLGPFTQFNNHGCGLSSDGSIACYFPGFGPAADELPAQGNNYVFLGETYLHSVAITTEGDVVYFGVAKDDEIAPAALETPGRAFVQVHASDNMTCGIDIDGNLLCWGLDVALIHACE